MVFQKYRHRYVSEEENCHVLSLEAQKDDTRETMTVMEKDKLLTEERGHLLVHVEP